VLCTTLTKAALAVNEAAVRCCVKPTRDEFVRREIVAGDWRCGSVAGREKRHMEAGRGEVRHRAAWRRPFAGAQGARDEVIVRLCLQGDARFYRFMLYFQFWRWTGRGANHELRLYRYFRLVVTLSFDLIHKSLRGDLTHANQRLPHGG
jgi:hypothetical protein